MTPKEFEQVRNELNQECEKLMLCKGRDYTDGVDRLFNFKQVATLLGLTPTQVWATYCYKHFIAVMNYAKDGKVQSEAIEGRFQDLRNYVDLGYGLMKEASMKGESVKTLQTYEIRDAYDYSVKGMVDDGFLGGDNG